jgi:hypothetical protein
MLRGLFAVVIVASFSGGNLYAQGYGYGGGMGTSGSEQLYPYDAPEPWLHGYFQEIPAYGGYKYFRPYNYRHVLSQSQTAGGWGMNPTMAYSQQFWHRYQARSRMERHQPDFSEFDNPDNSSPQRTPGRYPNTPAAPQTAPYQGTQLYQQGTLTPVQAIQSAPVRNFAPPQQAIPQSTFGPVFPRR